MDAITILDTALDQVTRLQENVSQAVLPASGLEAVQSLGTAQQNLDRLQQLAAQLHKLAAAVQSATPPVAQPGKGQQEAWVSGIQEQAKQAAAALQQQVSATLSGPSPGLMCLVQQSPQHAHMPQDDTGPHILWQLLQRVRAAAPHLAIHLFRSASDRILCSCDSSSSNPYDLDKPRGQGKMDEAAVAHISAYVDEVRVVSQGVFVAAIAISPPGSLQPVRVCVDSADKATTVDPWTGSKHQVFKRISSLSIRALQHFQTLAAAHAMLEPTPGSTSSSSRGSGAEGVALEALLLWLACYDDLFSRPCDVSGKVVTWAPGTATPLPPYVRPYWLSLDELRKAASNKGARKAYHAHLTPWPRPSDNASAAAAALAATLTAANKADSMANGSTVAAADAEAAAAGHAAGIVGSTSVGNAGGTAAGGCALTPWDAQEFTDDELREQLRHVIGDVF